MLCLWCGTKRKGNNVKIYCVFTSLNCSILKSDQRVPERETPELANREYLFFVWYFISEPNLQIRNIKASFVLNYWEYNIFECVLFVKCVDIYVLCKLDVDKGNRENCGRQGTLAVVLRIWATIARWSGEYGETRHDKLNALFTIWAS